MLHCEVSVMGDEKEGIICRDGIMDVLSFREYEYWSMAILPMGWYILHAPWENEWGKASS